MDHGDSRLEAILAEIAEEFPRFRLIRKDRSRWQRTIHYGLVFITFGQMREYLSGYHTTMGQRIYVTSDWDDLCDDTRYVTLRHERIHLRQFRRYSLPLMALLYVFLPLPMGLAYFRSRFEKQAYAETIRASAEVWGLDHVRDQSFRDGILRQFTGPSYGWMWPFRRNLDNWFETVLAKI
jgi:hypothetical protein